MAANSLGQYSGYFFFFGFLVSFLRSCPFAISVYVSLRLIMPQVGAQR